MNKHLEANVLLKLSNAGVAYPSGGRFSKDKFWALDGVNLELRRGETLGVIGRNGVGKSTLLKLLAGIIAADKGTVQWREGLRTSLLALQLGFMAQLSGRDNAIMSCILLGMTRKQAVVAVKRIFEFAELEEAIEKPVATYSSGMRARLGFGVAMEANPDVLLIDEVLGVGDAKFRDKSSKLLTERISSGRSVVIVSHELNTLKRLCDRLVYIDKGRTVIEGDVNSVAERYMNDQNLGPASL